MTDSWWPRPPRPDRMEADPNRVAYLIPGHQYSADRPLLHFARAVLSRHGWTTEAVWWPERPPQRDGQNLSAWFAQIHAYVHTYLSKVLDAEPAPEILLVGKSMGAFAASVAADRGLPGIWLTPVLRDTELPADLQRSTAPYLLVGASADPSWDAEVARSLGRPFYEADGANHKMETDDDPVNSAEILRRTTIAMNDFVAGR